MTELPQGLGAALAFIVGASIGQLRQRGRLPACPAISRSSGRARFAPSAIGRFRPGPISRSSPIRPARPMPHVPAADPLSLLPDGASRSAVTGLFLYLIFPLPEAGARFVLCAALFARAHRLRLANHSQRDHVSRRSWRASAPRPSSIPQVGWQTSLAESRSARRRAVRGYLNLYLPVRRRGRGRDGRCVSCSAMVGGFLGWRGCAVHAIFRFALRLGRRNRCRRFPVAGNSGGQIPRRRVETAADPGLISRKPTTSRSAHRSSIRPVSIAGGRILHALSAAASWLVSLGG